MKVDPVRFSIAFAASVSLFALYVVFIAHFYPVLEKPLSLVEYVIFYSLALRALALLIIPRFRHAYSPIKIVVFSIEMLVVIAYVVAFSITGDRSYFAIMGTIFPAWIAASFFILLPYFILEFGIGLLRGERLLPTLAGGVLLLADSVFAANFVKTGQVVPQNLVVLGSESISSVVRQPALVSLGGFSDIIVSVAGVVFYVSMLGYVAFSRIEHTSYPGKYTFALLIMLVGNGFLVAWTFLFLANHITNMFWILSVPGIMIPTFLLVGFYEKQK